MSWKAVRFSNIDVPKPKSFLRPEHVYTDVYVWRDLKQRKKPEVKIKVSFAIYLF